MPRLNKITAEKILDDNISTHEGCGRWEYPTSWGTYEYGRFFYADFNIKIRFDYRLHRELTDQEWDYIENVSPLVFDYELEYLIDWLKTNEPKLLGAWQTGRSGGWLACKFHAPETVLDAINLAYAVQRIAEAVEKARQFVSSYEYWKDELEANMRYKCSHCKDRGEDSACQFCQVSPYLLTSLGAGL